MQNNNANRSTPSSFRISLFQFINQILFVRIFFLTFLVFIFISNMAGVLAQDSLSEKIKDISDHLENVNNNEFIRSNEFQFTFAMDTLRVYNKKVWKYDVVEEYMEVIPIKNISTVKAERFYGTNSLVILGKSTEEGFTRHVIHKSQTVASTHLFVSSDGDALAFARLASLIQGQMELIKNK